MNTPSEDQEFKYRRKVKGVILFVICLICYIAYKKNTVDLYYCFFLIKVSNAEAKETLLPFSYILL